MLQDVRYVPVAPLAVLLQRSKCHSLKHHSNLTRALEQSRSMPCFVRSFHLDMQTHRPGWIQGPRTAGEPVKESSLKRGSVVNRSAPSRLQGSTLNAPLGRCGARESTSAMISAPIGVRDAGLSTNGHLRRGASSSQSAKAPLSLGMHAINKNCAEAKSCAGTEMRCAAVPSACMRHKHRLSGHIIRC